MKKYIASILFIFAMVLSTKSVACQVESITFYGVSADTSIDCDFGFKNQTRAYSRTIWKKWVKLNTSTQNGFSTFHQNAIWGMPGRWHCKVSAYTKQSSSSDWSFISSATGVCI